MFPSAKWAEIAFLPTTFLAQGLMKKNMGNYLGKEFEIYGSKVKYKPSGVFIYIWGYFELQSITLYQSKG